MNKFKDNLGNLPEVGGFIVNHMPTNVSINKARIIQIADNVLFIGQWLSPHSEESESSFSCIAFDTEKAIKSRNYTFKPKPKEPKKEIPPDGTIVKVWYESHHQKVRVSSGEHNEEGYILCYVDGDYSGDRACWQNWEVI